MNRTFHANVGWWYWLLIAITSAFMFLCFWEHRLFFAFILAIADIFEIEMLIHTQYVLTDSGVLKIETGRFVPKTNIEIANIISLRNVRSMAFFAPALSFDRLEITFRTPRGNIYSIYISPKNKKDFVNALIKRNNKIRIEQI